MEIEIVPAVLRRTWEGITEDWNKVVSFASHIQVDITDGVFAGDGTFREVSQFKKLPESKKAELHLMVHNPGHYVEEIVDLNPARVVFHVEAFADGGHIDQVYKKLREQTDAELGLALNPTSPNEWLAEQIELIDYVLFLTVMPGYPGAEFRPEVLQKIGAWRKQHPQMPIAVDGHVNKETAPQLVEAGANILCANSSILKEGDPKENWHQLHLVAEAAV